MAELAFDRHRQEHSEGKRHDLLRFGQLSSKHRCWSRWVQELQTGYLEIDWTLPCRKQPLGVLESMRWEKSQTLVDDLLWFMIWCNMVTHNWRISKSDRPLSIDSCLFARASLSSVSNGTALTPIAAIKGMATLMIWLMLYIVCGIMMIKINYKIIKCLSG